jgi:murein DD-endopeptidase MepM/ murein hydrolase activator NlpD
MGFKRFGKNGKRTTATFGRTTERYVRELQGRLGHAPDGVVTEDLWRELMHERLHQAVAPPPRSVDDVPTEIEGIPFAEPRGQVWPVCCSVDEGRHVAFQGERELHDLEHAPGRWFGARRSSGRMHVAVDLFGDEGDPILAMQPGVITAQPHFFRGTHGLFVWDEATDTTVNYGEVARHSWRAWGLDVGSRVTAGQPIAMVGLMRRDAMTHLEIYRGRVQQNHRYYFRRGSAGSLLNPTRYLLALAQAG